jgi:hypothetical protein
VVVLIRKFRQAETWERETAPSAPCYPSNYEPFPCETAEFITKDHDGAEREVIFCCVIRVYQLHMLCRYAWCCDCERWILKHLKAGWFALCRFFFEARKRNAKTLVTITVLPFEIQNRYLFSAFGRMFDMLFGKYTFGLKFASVSRLLRFFVYLTTISQLQMLYVECKHTVKKNVEGRTGCLFKVQFRHFLVSIKENHVKPRLLKSSSKTTN